MFEQKLFKWINKALDNPLPDEVVSFCFNLYDTAGFQIELVGCGSFDATDPDWPCDEVYAPEPREQLEIPSKYSGKHWENCLEKITDSLTRYLQSDESGAKKLRNYKGVGVGFVDGDLTIIKSP
jgi:hypothetical protein